MARKPMVTRTIKTTKVNVLCLDVVAGEPFNKMVTLPRTFSDEKKLMKAVHENVDTETIKAVHIVDKQEVTSLYGMSESDFIASAKELDPESRKIIEQEAGTESEEKEEKGE